MVRNLKFILVIITLYLCDFTYAQNNEKRLEQLPEYLNQSFSVKRVTSRAYNSLGVSIVADNRVLFVTDKPDLPILQSKSRFRPYYYELVDSKTKKMPTRNLCAVADMKYNVAGICVDDSNTFMIAAVNDIAQNDFLAESRVTLIHIDISYGFSQCATPPFVELGYSYTQPFYDSKSKYLYFTSDMPGGKGGLDIYRVKRLGSNLWGKVENLAEINTPNNDVYPFIDGDGYVYFSTLTTNNGYDVFAWNPENRKPVRLPAPVNSRVDDFNYVKVNEKDAFVSRSSGNAQSTVIYRMLAF